jgi:hypothetical protein
VDEDLVAVGIGSRGLDIHDSDDQLGNIVGWVVRFL